MVLDHVESARSKWRSARTTADDADLWAQFCADEAGVAVNRYQPEKRLVILAGKSSIQCCDGRQSPPRWEPLPTRSGRALGKALIKRISLLEPAAPAHSITEVGWPGSKAGGLARGVPAAGGQGAGDEDQGG
jgi:hypothetical protein